MTKEKCVMEIRAGKQFRSKQERRQIVEETLKAGTSVSRVARAHDINANQVFYWRQQYREGRLDEPGAEPTALVPVKICDAMSKSVVAKRRTGKTAVKVTAGIIEIDLGHARVRIEGIADPDCVRAAMEGLIR
jgi:transposase